MTIALLIQNGHRYEDVLTYSLSQFEAFATAIDRLLNHQLARHTIATHTATQAAPKDVEKFLESIRNG